MEVKYKLLSPMARQPVYKTEGAACLDLYASRLEIKDGYIEYFTDVAFEIPKGYMGLLFARSSVTQKEIHLQNAVGVIDSDFRDGVTFRFVPALQFLVPRRNDADKPFNGVYDIDTTNSMASVYAIGERIGQMMILPIMHITLIEATELSHTVRGTGGYGSTGNS